MRSIGAWIAASTLLVACSSSSDGGSSGGGAPPAEVNALYETLPAATPDKLRGVWSQTQTKGENAADLRFRFSDGRIVGGIKCTFGAQHGPVLVGQGQPLETADLEGKSGSFTLGAPLTFGSTEPGVTCTGHMEAATWQFAINGATLTLTQTGKSGSATFQKIGD